MKNLAAILGVATISLIMVVLFLTDGTTMPVSAKNHSLISASLEKDEAFPLKNEKKELTHDNIVQLTNRFMDILVQDSEENYKVKQFNTKEDLLTEFEKVSTRETAKSYVDFYYEEKADGMYILPTETPPWFIQDNDYDIEQVSNNTVKIIQNNTTDLDGNYTIEMEFTYHKTWKITNITHR
ncbi:hypothetical protein [Oceanobacillus halophilus]|uniref:DUF3993 domain-containing protein n=1 Tax=Oceanobacillus halophilus TaxID=930130 RepID=A0A494ZTN9_9BACI|nr:hypothetical protein [Oceanobacillus halophilus]RKQ29566.1 hypothetical protein D8M06_17390 [Oceanobacillus halophilus]